jgi:hypothetical protein
LGVSFFGGTGVWLFLFVCLVLDFELGLMLAGQALLPLEPLCQHILLFIVKSLMVPNL